MVFGFIIACEQIASFVAHALVYQYNDNYYTYIGTLGSLFFLIMFMIIDLAGYYLIRKALLDAMVGLEPIKQSNSIEEIGSLNPSEELTDSQRPLSVSITSSRVDQTPSASPSLMRTLSNVNKNDQPIPAPPVVHELNYHDFLIRMRRFHIILNAVLIFLFIMIMTNFVGLKHGPPLPPNPQVYTFGTSSIIPYLYVFLWGVLSWWAWIPLRYVTGSQSVNSKTTKMSIHRDHQHHHYDHHDHDRDQQRTLSTVQSKDAPTELLMHNSKEEEGRGDSPSTGEEPFPVVKEEENRDKEYSPPNTVKVVLVKITENGDLVPQDS